LRRLALNLVTGSATILLLAVLALPAERVLEAPAHSEGASWPSRAFGVYVDPWHLDEWAHDVGAAPQFVAKFEAFSKRRGIDEFLRESERQGVSRVLVSWEPWRPVPTARGLAAQFRPQFGYRNADIATGWQDPYISGFARSLARFKGIVYLRYAHEMNGTWYPWSHDPESYRRAWRRMVRLVRRAGADNVRFVWSVNPSLYLPTETWLGALHRYWPGSRYVDAIGSTMINFGGRKDYTVRRFAPRLRALHRAYPKPMMITEANTEYADRLQWLLDFRGLLARMPWIKSIAWSQLPSRGKAHLAGVGNLEWSVRRDPAAAAVLQRIIADGLRPRAR
jgi:glycosyl hydrolase family 26